MDLDSTVFEFDAPKLVIDTSSRDFKIKRSGLDFGQDWSVSYLDKNPSIVRFESRRDKKELLYSQSNDVHILTMFGYFAEGPIYIDSFKDPDRQVLDVNRISIYSVKTFGTQLYADHQKLVQKHNQRIKSFDLNEVELEQAVKLYNAIAFSVHKDI